MNQILENIAQKWKLEAKLEKNENYFFYTNEYNEIINSKKCYIIGRKGSGKSAICEKIVSITNDNFYAEKLSFKNFPFNELYSLSNDAYTPPNQYITLWKYIIYSTVCKLMCRTKGIDTKIKKELLILYPENDSFKTLSRKIKDWIDIKFGVEFFGLKGTIELSHDISNKKLNWIEKVDILEDIIMQYCRNEKYFIVFDELDEDYRDFHDKTNERLYINLLTSLFKAVQDIQSTFEHTQKNIRPIIFLRDDIYSLIKDSDKNKWRDYKIEIEWTDNKIKQMLTHRISCDADIKTNIDFKKAWELICSNEKVWFGNKQRNNCSIFEYITKSTLFRPRDYIRYIQVCAENTVERKIDRIRAHTVKYVDRAFSNYIKEEFIDELFPIIPEIETVFDILSNQRKWNIKVKDFITVYNTYLKSGAIQEGNIEKLLDTLFNFSVIGNQHPKRIDVQYFKYIQTNMKFNKNENIVIHRGLFKSLGII